MHHVATLDRPPYREFVKNYLRPRRPLIMKGALSEWPASTRWRLEYFAEKLQGRPITPIVLDHGFFRLDVESGVKLAPPMSFEQYASDIEGTRRPSSFLRLPLEGHHRRLFEDDIVTPEYCKRHVRLTRNRWIAGTGATSDLHYDMTHNLIAQVQGTRSVTLYAPSETPKLYPFPRRTLNHHHSQVHVEAPDLHRFPRFALAKPLEFVLSAGEMLFIPRGWWHRLHCLEPSVAVNYFWLTKRLVPAIAVARALWVARGLRT